jgi:hypothetical protein
MEYFHKTPFSTPLSSCNRLRVMELLNIILCLGLFAETAFSFNLAALHDLITKEKMGENRNKAHAQRLTRRFPSPYLVPLSPLEL